MLETIPTFSGRKLRYIPSCLVSVQFEAARPYPTLPWLVLDTLKALNFSWPLCVYIYLSLSIYHHLSVIYLLLYTVYHWQISSVFCTSPIDLHRPRSSSCCTLQGLQGTGGLQRAAQGAQTSAAEESAAPVAVLGGWKMLEVGCCYWCVLFLAINKLLYIYIYYKLYVYYIYICVCLH